MCPSSQNEIRASVYRKRRQLKQAFDVLKVWSNEMWVITQKRWLILMKEVCPRWSPARVALLWQVLDENNEGKIGKMRTFITSQDSSKHFSRTSTLLRVTLVVC